MQNKIHYNQQVKITDDLAEKIENIKNSESCGIVGAVINNNSDINISLNNFLLNGSTAAITVNHGTSQFSNNSITDSSLLSVNIDNGSTDIDSRNNKITAPIDYSPQSGNEYITDSNFPYYSVGNTAEIRTLTNNTFNSKNISYFSSMFLTDRRYCILVAIK